MTGKQFLDKEYPQPRGNGNGLSSILDKFAEEKFKDALKNLPRHLVQINQSSQTETVEVDWLLNLLNIDKNTLYELKKR